MFQLRAFKLADPLPNFTSKMKLEVRMPEDVYGREKPGGVASPIDFLCKMDISKFMACL